MAHPVGQRRGILAGPHRRHAEPHYRPHLSLCRGGLQVVPVGGTHDHPRRVEDQDRTEPLGVQQAQRLTRRGALPGRAPAAAGEHSPHLAPAPPPRVTTPPLPLPPPLLPPPPPPPPFS